MTNKALSFSLELEELPVEIDGQPYVLQELDGKDRDKYLTNIGGRLRQNAKGEAGGVKNFDGLQASLVAKSLKKIVDGAKVAVTQEAIQAFPARVVAGLFKEAQKLSKLGDEGKNEEEPGND